MLNFFSIIYRFFLISVALSKQLFIFKIEIEHITLELDTSYESKDWYFQSISDQNNQYSGVQKNNLFTGCSSGQTKYQNAYYYKIPQQLPLDKSSYTFKKIIDKPFWRTEATFELVLQGGSYDKSIKWIQPSYLLAGQSQNITQLPPLSRQDDYSFFCEGSNDATLLKYSMVIDQQSKQTYSQEIYLNFKPLQTFPTGSGQKALVKFLNIFVDTCHYTCKSCTGPTVLDCIECIDGAEIFSDQKYCKCKDGKYFDKGKCVSECPPSTLIIEKDNNYCLDQTELQKFKFFNINNNNRYVEFSCDGSNKCSMQALTETYFGILEIFGSGFEPNRATQFYSDLNKYYGYLEPINPLPISICENNSILSVYKQEAQWPINLFFKIDYDGEVEISFDSYTIDNTFSIQVRYNDHDWICQMIQQREGNFCGENINDRFYKIKCPLKNTTFKSIAIQIRLDRPDGAQYQQFGIRNFSIQFQYKVVPKCLTESSQCTACIPGHFVLNNKCVQCGFLCKECNKRNECKSCFDGFYLHDLMKTCIFGCENSAYTLQGGECKCKIGYSDELKQCVANCPNGTYSDNGVCKQCLDGCDLCSSQNTCSKCSPNKYLYQQTCVVKCPNGYNNEDGQTCAQCQFPKPCIKNCHPSCKTCNNNSSEKESCSSCYSSRQLQTQTCNCRKTGDTRYSYYECNEESKALLEISLSSIDNQMIINFGENLSPIASSDSINFCKTIFTQETLDKVGSKSECSLVSNQIIVKLKEDSKVVDGEVIKFKNVFSFSRNSLTLIDTFYNQIAKQDILTETCDVQFKYDQIINNCRKIVIKIEKIKGDSQRGFNTFSWSIKVKNDNKEVQLQELESFITDANDKKKSDLEIPAGIIPPNFIVTFIFDYTFLNKGTGKKEIEISVVSRKDVFLDQQSLIPNPYFIYEPLDLLFVCRIETCNGKLEIITVQEPFNIKIVSVQNPALNLEKYLKDKSELQYLIDPYVILPNSATSLKAIVSLESNPQFSATLEFIINSGFTDLIIRTEGSNQIVDYRSKITIEGYGRDMDLLDENQDQGITYRWSCFDFIKKSPCVNQKGETYIISQTGTELIVQPSTFNPYLSLLFKFEGKKGDRISSDSVIVILSELNIPNLKVKLQKQDSVNNKVNLNEEIVATLEYDPTVNTDILSFSGAILYNDAVVGKIKFDYTKVRLIVWDYHSDFDPNQTKFQVRFSVYNPEYIMPSLSILQFEINLPPKNCKLNVSSPSGVALETKFTFTLSNCEDNDQPIRYQFLYYSSEEQYKLEKKNPLLIQRKQISDIQLKQSISGSLPPGDLIVIALAIDSRNAIFNITQKIQVTKKNYQQNEYMALIDSYLNNNQKTPQENSYDLSLLSQDLVSRDEFNKIGEFNQKKLELINKLVEVSKQLPSSSTFSNLINKSTISLQQKIVDSPPQEQQKRIDSIDEQLQSLESLNLNKNSQNRESLKVGLYDQFSILDSIKIDQGDKQLEKKVVSISDTIGKLLNKLSLPNEDIKIFKGNNFEISSEKVTSKYLYQYFCCGTLEDLSKDPSKKEQPIYDLSFSRMKQNPYVNDDSFQEYRNEVLKKKSDLQFKNYEVIQPSIAEDQKQVQFNQNLVHQFKMDKSDQNLACLTKIDNKWSKDGCSITYQEQIGSYQCQCKKVSATTLIEDVADIFDGKNVQTAFGEQGLENLAKFDDFYTYVAFWVLVFKSVIAISFVVYGRKLDAASQKDLNTFVKPNSILPIQNQNIENKKKKKVLPDHLSFQMSRNNSQQFSQICKEEEELKIQNLDKEITSPRKEIKLEKNKSSDQEGNKNSPPQQEIKTEFDSNNQINLFNSISNDKKLINNESQPQKLSQFSAQKHDQLIKQPFIRQLILFHGFFNIFFVYNPNLSRALRFVTFYIRLVHSLTVSIVFNESYSLIQILVLSVINGIVLQIFLAIFQKLASIQRVRVLSTIFTTLIAGGYYYLILSIVSGQSTSESNKFFLPYCIMIGSDILVIGSLAALLQRQLALVILQKRTQSSCSLKISNALQLHIIIQNLV